MDSRVLRGLGGSPGKVHCHRALQAGESVVGAGGGRVAAPSSSDTFSPLHTCPGTPHNNVYQTSTHAYMRGSAPRGVLTVYRSESPVVGVLHMASRRHGGVYLLGKCSHMRSESRLQERLKDLFLAERAKSSSCFHVYAWMCAAVRQPAMIKPKDPLQVFLNSNTLHGIIHCVICSLPQKLALPG